MIPLTGRLQRLFAGSVCGVDEIEGAASQTYASSQAASAVASIPTALPTARGLYRADNYQVESYGALPAPANATAAFQTAIDAAAAAGGGIVSVPSGKTFILSGVQLRSGVTLEGRCRTFPAGLAKLKSLDAATPMFLATNRVYSYGLRYLAIEGPEDTFDNGSIMLRCAVAGSGDQYGLELSHLSVWKFDRVVDVGAEIGVTEISSYHQFVINHCLFAYCNHGGRFNAANVTALSVRDCGFVTFERGLDFEDIGYAVVENSTSAGGGAFIRNHFCRNALRVYGCQSEQQDYFLEHTGGSGDQVISLRDCICGRQIRLATDGTKLLLDNCTIGKLHDGSGIVCSGASRAEIAIRGRTIPLDRIQLNANSRIVEYPGRRGEFTTGAPDGLPRYRWADIRTTSPTVVIRATVPAGLYSLRCSLVNTSGSAVLVELRYPSAIGGAANKDTLHNGTLATDDIDLGTKTFSTYGGEIALVITRAGVDGVLHANTELRSLVPDRVERVDPSVALAALQGQLNDLRSVWVADRVEESLDFAALYWGASSWWAGSVALTASAAKLRTGRYLSFPSVKASSTEEQTLSTETGTYQSVTIVAVPPAQPHAQAWSLADTVSSSTKMFLATAGGTTWDTSGGWTHYCDGVQTETIPSDGFAHTFEAVNASNTAMGLAIGGVNAWPTDVVFIAAAAGVPTVSGRAAARQTLLDWFEGTI